MLCRLASLSVCSRAKVGSKEVFCRYAATVTKYGAQRVQSIYWNVSHNWLLGKYQLSEAENCCIREFAQ